MDRALSLSRVVQGDDERAREQADDELLARLRCGDERAFSDLIARHHAALVRVAMAFVSDRATAEEVAQDTWMGVLRGLVSFEGRSSVKTWIFRILTNRAKTRGVREARSIPFSAFAEEGEAHVVDPSRFDASRMWSAPPRKFSDEDPEKILVRREAVARVEEVLATLPAGQRAVITLRDVEGLDADEVCNVLGISETNQRVLLHRARSRIRQALEDTLGAR